MWTYKERRYTSALMERLERDSSFTPHTTVGYAILFEYWVINHDVESKQRHHDRI